MRKKCGQNNCGVTLDQSCNDRPYVDSSFLSVPIAEVFGTALACRCKDRPELAETPIPLRAVLTVDRPAAPGVRALVAFLGWGPVRRVRLRWKPGGKILRRLDEA